VLADGGCIFPLQNKSTIQSAIVNVCGTLTALPDQIS